MQTIIENCPEIAKRLAEIQKQRQSDVAKNQDNHDDEPDDIDIIGYNSDFA